MLELVPMTRERMHEYFRRFVTDPDLFADGAPVQPYCYDSARVDAFFDKRQARTDAVSFAVLLDGAVVGDVGLKHIDRDRRACELEIHLTDDSVKNRGIGTEAERRMLRHAFDTLGMETVRADCTLKNNRSQHVLEKLGFQPVGEDGAFRQYALSRKDYLGGAGMPYILKPMETEAEIRGKAYVHWKSWQESYAGIVDAGYLDRLTLEKCEEIAFRYPESVLVAKDGERVVGFAAAGRYRGTDGSDSDEGEVYAIYVLSEYQKQKLGYALMRACLDRLRDCRKIFVWVFKDNRKAIAFYERVGFRADGEEKELLLGTPVKAIRMTLSHLFK